MAHGATHYTHWFVPMTGSTAEKHDSFLNPTGDGQTIAEFSGKNLVQGEPDASSFPSGGIRATFEARGYTAWDSPARSSSRWSPTASPSPSRPPSCPTPARRWTTRSRCCARRRPWAARRCASCAGSTTPPPPGSSPTSAPSRSTSWSTARLAEQRPDLVLTGRTLFGAPSPKGQELEDQYFGPIRERILAFMMDLDRELWRLGIPSKTRHNEVAPGQFEMAPVYEPTSVGSDHNMIVMSTMRRLAPQHDLMFLIHEKPFAGINGSGKHNNWSMATDEGENLLDPGHDPHANAQFLAFLVAVIRAVNVHADLLRASIADAGNDHRLGANEAPPAIMSIFLGAQLEDVIDQLEKGAASASKQGGHVELGVTSLPVLPKDATDRNRTSPFAFTGNKFEFRAVGSSAPIYWPQTVLNTAVADSLAQLADELEALEHGDFEGLTTILSAIVRENRQVLFEGNGYSEEWHAEAARRGLPNNRTTVDALPALTTDKAKELFSKFGVLSERELAARAEINWERYVKVQNIEANCALDIARTMILPAAAATWASSRARRVEGDRVGRHQGRGPRRRAGGGHRRAGACPARRPRGGLRARRGAGVRRPVIPAQDLRGSWSTSSRRWSPTTCGRCPSTASCSSSTDRPGPILDSDRPSGRAGRPPGLRPGRGGLLALRLPGAAILELSSTDGPCSCHHPSPRGPALDVGPEEDVVTENALESSRRRRGRGSVRPAPVHRHPGDRQGRHHPDPPAGDSVAHGTWFDGSSIEGFTRIAESDQYLVPDMGTFAELPWQKGSGPRGTARVICDVYTPRGEPFVGDPRFILRRQVERARKLGFVVNMGPELEFFLFRRDEAGRVAPLPHDLAGYFDFSTDLAQEVRQDMVDALEAFGIKVEAAHHEVAAGQHEIDFEYSDALRTADNAVTFKFTLKAIAQQHGLYATFMPKPIFGINGSGMHTHLSL